VQEFVDLQRVGRVAKHRQAERRFGDEHVAIDRLERRTGRVRAAFVVAGDDDAAAAVIKDDLRAAQHVASRREGDGHPVDFGRFAVIGGLQRTAGIVAVALAHDRDRRFGRENRAVARPGMVAMAMRHDGARHRQHRVYVEIARLAVETGRGCPDPSLRMRRKRFQKGHRQANYAFFVMAGLDPAISGGAPRIRGSTRK